MTNLDLSWLVQDIRDSTVILGICVFVLLLNQKMTRPTPSYLRRWKLAFWGILIWYICFLSYLLFQDRFKLAKAFDGSPVLTALLCLVGIVVALSIAFGLTHKPHIPRLGKERLGPE